MYLYYNIININFILKFVNSFKKCFNRVYYMNLNTPKCLICGGDKLVKYLDLGKSALANSFLKKSELQKKERLFPLQVFYCKDCHLAQLTELVDRKILFANYNFFSSASSPLEDYFKQYVIDLKKNFPVQSNDFVVEIGSNDGILLKNFDQTKTKILGIDPAKNIAKIANQNGIKTLPIFFNTKSGIKIAKDYGKATIIIANHALAHNDNLHDMISGVKELLDENGIFAFEVQYIANLLAKNQFDNTYHEHASYFSLSPLVTLLEKHDMKIFNVEETSAQGGSIRVFSSNKKAKFLVKDSVKKLLKKEEKNGLHNLKIYKEFGKHPQIIKKDLISLLKKLKKEGKKIVGYGASAKGNTLLQYMGIDTKLIDYIIDTTPSKQGKYTPGTHIPVYGPKKLEEETPDYVLILAWNYAETIMKKESSLQKKGVKFIVPIPKVKII